MSGQQSYEARLARVEAALAGKQSDRVPVVPFARSYPYTRLGHTLSEAIYNQELAEEGLRRFVLDYEPDMAVSYTAFWGGAGRALEAAKCPLREWPGRPGGHLTAGTPVQLIERPTLGEEDYEAFANPAAFLPHPDPDTEEARAYGRRAAAFERELAALGYPVAFGAALNTPFDVLSGYLRGTLGLMTDFFVQDEEVQQALETLLPLLLEAAAPQLARSLGRFVYLPLHKGTEGYLGRGQFEEFYFPTLLRLVEGLVAQGFTPVLYAEGKYDANLETLARLPAGKVVLHFENVDMAEARRILGGQFCLSGGFYSYGLLHGTPQQISDYLKRLLDAVASEGGYIFDFSDRLDEAQPENVEALFRTLRDY